MYIMINDVKGEKRIDLSGSYRWSWLLHLLNQESRATFKTTPSGDRQI